MSEVQDTRDWFAQRAAIRKRIGADDATIEEFEQRMRASHPELPAMEPSEDELSVSPTAAITVSVGWLAWVVRQFPVQSPEGAQHVQEEAT